MEHASENVLKSLFNKAARLQDCCKTYLLHSHLLFSQNLKKFHQLSINYLLVKNVKCKVTFTEAYLEPSQTSTMKVFDEEKGCLMDVSLDSKYNSGLLDTTCKMAPLNSFILQYSSYNQFIFWFQKLKHYTERHLMTNFTHL